MEPAAIEMLALLASVVAAVNVTVREVPVVDRPERNPRVTVKSEIVKSLTLSVNVMVREQVAPAA